MSLTNFYQSLSGDRNLSSTHARGLRVYGDIDKGANPLNYMRIAINRIYEDALRNSHEGTWTAHVLHSVIEYEKSPQAVSINDHLGKKKRRIKVIAHVPDLDAALPLPKMLGLTSKMTTEDKTLMAMHRVFYSDGAGNMTLPSVGDRIEVDFEDRNNHMYGVYKGPKEHGIGSIPDHPDAQIASGKVQSYFKKGKRRSLLGSFPEADIASVITKQEAALSEISGIPESILIARRSL
tara:strand:+ start:20944 stop:21651 length:708 start_codon:yes stop_codon:yes gene_type:complete